jgi:hypothetical protein
VRWIEALVPSALILVLDADATLVPTELDGIVGVTPEAVSVGTRHGADGPTRICLVRSQNLDSGERPDFLLFSGQIEARSGIVQVESVEGDVYAQTSTSAGVTHLEVWGNNRAEPTRLLIVLG